MTEKKASATVGMFDGVHRGHRFLLDFLKSQNRADDRPTVFTFANHPLEIIRPDAAPMRLSTPAEKRKLLEEEGVNVVMPLFDDKIRSLSALQFLEKLRDQYNVGRLVVGFNNHFGNERGQSIKDYRSIGKTAGVDIIEAPEFKDIKVSSSIIRRHLADGDIKTATGLLGHRYSLGGTVIPGKRLGRTIGFPTANIMTGDQSKLIPKQGVYAVDVTVDESSRSFRGILNIGNRPTVDDDGRLSIEVHIDGFSGDIYGHTVEMEFLDRLRDERRFDNILSLSQQLKEDLEQARGY